MGSDQLKEHITIVVAAARQRRCEQLCLKLVSILPETTLLSALGVEEMRDVIQSGVPGTVIINHDLFDEVNTPEALTALVRRTSPNVHVVWILSKQSAVEPWFERARNSDVEILRPPIGDVELAQQCLGTHGKIAQLRGANRRLADLARQHSESLYESDERYRLLVNSCSDGVMTIRLGSEGTDFRVEEVNNQLCQLLGYRRAEFLELRPRDLVEPHRIRYVNARVESLRLYRHIFFETVLVARDGRQTPVGITARLFSFDRDPYIIFVVRAPNTYVYTPQRISEQAFGELVHQTGQVVYEYTLATRELRASGATVQIFGYTSEQLQGASQRALLQMIHENDRRRLVVGITHAVDKLRPFENRYRIIHRSGEVRYVEDIGVVMPDETGQASLLLGNIKDITERVRSEQEQSRAEQTIQHSKRMESLGVLAGGIAHDFNNILAGIIGLTDISIQALEGVNPEILEDLNESLGAAHRAKDLIKQILAFSRQSGEEHSPLYLHAVVHEVLGLVRASLTNSIRIVDNVDTQSGMVMANATQMHQVVMNFCTNGLQAMSGKGGVLEVRLEDFEVTPRFANTNSKLRPGPYVKLTVSDRGHGMEQSVVRRVFDPFFTTKGPGEGTGMGLAMVYGIVADHGGAVLVDSVLGQGAEFCTFLPRVEGVLQEDATYSSRVRGGTERLLVVDDEQPVRRFCERALGQLGYAVKTEERPQAALDAIKIDPDAFDLVIADYQMPDINGLTLARRIRKIRPNLPVVLFTGFSENVSEAEARNAGIHEIVSKPVVVSQLAETLRRALDKSSEVSTKGQ